jgi:hypothetical protein
MSLILRAAILMAFADVSIRSCQGGAELATTPLCEVVSHLDEHLGKDLVLKGLIVSYEHGAYIMPEHPCVDTQTEGIRLTSLNVELYRTAGGRKGFGIRGTVKGKLTNSGRRSNGGTKNVPELAVRNVSYDKTLPSK